MADFPYVKASIVLAHGQLFGKKLACNCYGIKSSTYDLWRNRFNSDRHLIELTQKELKKLADEWQRETVKTLKEGLKVTQLAFANHPFDSKPQTTVEVYAWAKAVESMNKAIKSLGDLATSTYILSQDDEDKN